jgi:AraC-like DNA-binding protein
MSTVESEWLTQAPSPRLAPFIEQYIGYRLLGFAPGLHRGLPSRNVTFIVSIGPAIDVIAQTDASQAPRQYRCVLSGLQASPALISHDGNQEGIAIDLTPIGFRTLFGLPARALWNTSVELDDVTRAVGTELWERLQGVRRWSARFAICDQVLCRVLGDDVVLPELRRSWGLLVASGGTASVARIADEVGWSRQHLTRRFRDEFGLPPKLAARVVRFERARRMLQSAPSFVSIAQIAATCGYYDQSHLTNDFAELAGCTPTQLIAEEERPSFQDAAGPGA